MKTKLFVLLLVLVTGVVGCQDNVFQPTPTDEPTNTPVPTNTAVPTMTPTPILGSENPFNDVELEELSQIVNAALDQIVLPEGCVETYTYSDQNWVDDDDPLQKMELIITRGYENPEAQTDAEKYCARVGVWIMSDYKQSLIKYLEYQPRWGTQAGGGSWGSADGGWAGQTVEVEECDENNFCHGYQIMTVNFRELGEGLNLLIEFGISMPGKTDYIDTSTNELAFTRPKAIEMVEAFVYDKIDETLIDPLKEWNQKRQ